MTSFAEFFTLYRAKGEKSPALSVVISSCRPTREQLLHYVLHVLHFLYLCDVGAAEEQAFLQLPVGVNEGLGEQKVSRSVL